ncbi:MAG: 16S rRNA processing protein RimM [Gammaproteobacteria bacterium AqS3]|nr:16S rRNA processing protein RimM [Gammaproteobacteria bacterium AqS3]
MAKTPQTDLTDRRTVLASVGAPFGVRGWVWLNSYTDDLERLLHHSPYQCGERTLELAEVERRSRRLCGRFAGVEDRDAAADLRGCELSVALSDLPELPAGEYYWTQLEGCRVINDEDDVLGEIIALQNAGAEDMMCVQDASSGRQFLLPFALDRVVREVDLEARTVRVHWPRDWI